jgi:hypothetical protein
MFTDNIVLYAAFYGNLQFTIIGLAYAAEKRARLEKILYEEDEFYENQYSKTSRSLYYREDENGVENTSTPALSASDSDEDTSN